MPIYSLDAAEYQRRVHQNGRGEDQVFSQTELLFRRYPRKLLLNGRPVPLTMQFDDKSGVSVNRGLYSEPHDVLEPDCCNGNQRPDSVVLEFAVSDVPVSIAGQDRREFRFSPKHVPKEQCYSHTEIWCNAEGDIERAYQSPSKQVRDIFRAELLRRIEEMGRKVHEFEPIQPAPDR